MIPSTDSQWWLARLQHPNCGITEIAECRDGSRVLVLRFIDEHSKRHVGELLIRPDGTWEAETL